MASSERWHPPRWAATLAAVGVPAVAFVLAVVVSLGLLAAFFSFIAASPPVAVPEPPSSRVPPPSAK